MREDVAEAEQFLFAEADLLDRWRLDEWLTLFTPDATYVVPNTDLPEGDPANSVVLIDDDWPRLQARVERMKSRFAHREYPWSRTRRLITNVRAETIEDHLEVRANFAVHRFRTGHAVYVGSYFFKLRRIDDTLKIVRRRAVLDNERLDEHGAVSIIL